MRVATWNVLHGRSHEDGRVDVGRVAAAVAALDVDVLALQEVDEPDAGEGGRPEVQRAELRRLLLDSLPEGTVRWGHKVTGVFGDDAPRSLVATFA